MQYDTTHNAYLGVLKEIYLDPEYRCAPRGLPIREKTNFMFKVMKPTSDPLITKDEARNKIIDKYTRQEMDLYNSCSNNVEDFAKASKFWRKIANPDGTINSAYGYLIWGNKSHGNPKFEAREEIERLSCAQADGIIDFTEYVTDKQVLMANKMRTPWGWAKRSLIADKDTRQAILRFSLPEHQWIGNKDQVCTLHGNFSIRKDKLNLIIVMRANDVVLGLAFDLPWFCSLIERMTKELKPTYPNLEVGTYTHLAHSMHMYERDLEKVEKMLGEQLI